MWLVSELLDSVKQTIVQTKLIDQAVIGDCFLKSLWLITLIVWRDTLTECVLGDRFHWKMFRKMFIIGLYFQAGRI